jgi:hypothetical protein
MTRATVEFNMDDQDRRSGRVGASSTAPQFDFVHPAVLLLPEPLESEFWQSTSAIRYAHYVQNKSIENHGSMPQFERC